MDVRDPVDHVDLVLTPACSPQLIAALKRKYGGARVIVVELDDWDFDVSLPGPVKRILCGGADAYVLADSVEELARKITRVTTGLATNRPSVDPRELPSTTTVDSSSPRSSASRSNTRHGSTPVMRAVAEAGEQRVR